MMLIRHLLSIALMPFVVVVLVPRALLARDALSITMPPTTLLLFGRIAVCALRRARGRAYAVASGD